MFTVFTLVLFSVFSVKSVDSIPVSSGVFCNGQSGVMSPADPSGLGFNMGNSVEGLLLAGVGSSGGGKAPRQTA